MTVIGKNCKNVIYIFFIFLFFFNNSFLYAEFTKEEIELIKQIEQRLIKEKQDNKEVQPSDKSNLEKENIKDEKIKISQESEIKELDKKENKIDLEEQNVKDLKSKESKFKEPESPSGPELTKEELDIIKKIEARFEKKKQDKKTKDKLKKSHSLKKKKHKKDIDFDFFVEKKFEMKNIKLEGDITQFGKESMAQSLGVSQEQELRLKISGHTDNIYAYIDYDDTLPTNDQKHIMIKIDNEKWDFEIGDFKLDFKDIEFAITNKKVLGISAKGTLPNHKVTGIVARSGGISGTQQFSGQGLQKEYRLEKGFLVTDSEAVYIDGKKKRKGADYTIDYEQGIVVFKTGNLPIEPRSTVVIDYEYSTGLFDELRRNLTCLRDVYSFKNKKGYIGFTGVDYADIRTQEDNSMGVSKSISSGSRSISNKILSLDFKLMSKNTKKYLLSEIARSFYDPNIYDEENKVTQEKQATAYKIKGVLENKFYKLDSLYKLVEPGFKSIGKLNIAMIGQTGKSLQGDVLLKDFKFNIKKSKKLYGDIELQKVETNLDEDLYLEKTDFDRSYYKGFYDFKKNLGVSVKYLSEEENTRNIHDVKTISDSVINEYYFYDKSKKLKNEISFKLEDLKDKEKSEDILRKALNLKMSLNSSKQAKYSFVWQKEEEFIKDVLDLVVENGLLRVSANPSSKFKLLSELVSRTVDSIKENKKDKNLTADLNMKYKPSKKISLDSKYKREQVKKFILDPETSVSREEPILKKVGSFKITHKPDKKIMTNLYYNFSSEEQVDTYVTKRDLKRIRTRYAPSKKWQLTLDVKRSENINTPSKIKEESEEFEYSLKREFPKQLSILLRFNDTEKIDKIKLEESEKKIRRGFELRKKFNKLYLSEFEYYFSDIDKLIVDRKESSFLVKTTYTPKDRKSEIITSYNLNFIEEAFSQKKSIYGVIYNFHRSKEQTVSTEYKITDAGPTDQGKGYKLKEGKISLNIRF